MYTCDTSQWRRTWSRTTANGSSATRGYHSGTPGIPLGSSTRGPGAPLPLCSYVTGGRLVIDRIRGACLVTCSSRHLTSHIFHSYISTTHSLRPQGLCYFIPVCSRSVQATSLGSEDNERVIGILVAIRVGWDRDSHTLCTHGNNLLLCVQYSFIYFKFNIVKFIFIHGYLNCIRWVMGSATN